MSDCENFCPRGNHGDPVKECTCTLAMVSRCQKRIAGPLLDRIDIDVEVPRVEYEWLSDDRLAERFEWFLESVMGVDRAQPGMRGRT